MRRLLLTTDKLLLRIAGLLLFLVGLLKIVSAFSGVAYLAQPDPVLTFLNNKLVLLLAGNAELFLAGIILLVPKAWYARFGLLAICATFVMYRIGLSVLHVRSPCPCLGRASDWLHLTPRQVDSLALILLLILQAIS